MGRITLAVLVSRFLNGHKAKDMRRLFEVLKSRLPCHVCHADFGDHESMQPVFYEGELGICHERHRGERGVKFDVADGDRDQLLESLDLITATAFQPLVGSSNGTPASADRSVLRQACCIGDHDDHPRRQVPKFVHRPKALLPKRR